jgi:hypothetical protein
MQMTGQVECKWVVKSMQLRILEKHVAYGAMKRLYLREGKPGGRLCLAYPNADLMTTPARDFVVWLRSSVRNAGTSDHFTLAAG